MKTKIHFVSAIVASLVILTFFLSTVLVEIFGGSHAVVTVKRFIVYGLVVLIPSIAVTGITGTLLAKSRTGRLVGSKKKRMPFIAANGLVILVPSAIILDRLASAGSFGSMFYAIQVLELVAGAMNIALMFMNFRDGIRLSGRLPLYKES
jgi:hypothetical protein